MRLRKNLDIYLTILLSFVAAGLGIFGIVDQTIVQAAILALIALVSFSLLTNRVNSDEVKQLVKEMKSHEELPNRFFSKEYTGEKIKALMNESSTVYLWGVTLYWTIPYLSSSLVKSMHNGCEVRILLSKPKSSATRMAAFANQKTDQDQLDGYILNNIAALSRIARQDVSGKLTVRVVEYFPPYSMCIFSPNLPSGQIVARLLTYKVPNDERPAFSIEKKSDYWFSFFLNQFESVWEEGEEVDIHSDYQG